MINLTYALCELIFYPKRLQLQSFRMRTYVTTFPFYLITYGH
jgi:hypothetical protein